MNTTRSQVVAGAWRAKLGEALNIPRGRGFRDGFIVCDRKMLWLGPVFHGEERSTEWGMVNQCA